MTNISPVLFWCLLLWLGFLALALLITAFTAESGLDFVGAIVCAVLVVALCLAHW